MADCALCPRRGERSNRDPRTGRLRGSLCSTCARHVRRLENLLLSYPWGYEDIVRYLLVKMDIPLARHRWIRDYLFCDPEVTRALDDIERNQ